MVESLNCNFSSEIQHLYEQPTARAVLSSAGILVKGKTPKERVVILHNSDYQKVVLAALNGIDENRENAIQEYIETINSR